MSLGAAGWVVAGFLAGSVPTGYLLVRAATGEDVRDIGSGNPGATNVARAAGLAWGLGTLVVDVGKGLAVTAAAFHLPGGGPAVAAAAGGAAVVGHAYSPWLWFRGGKGVATAAGVYAWLAPAALAWIALLFLLVVALSRRVAVGSILAALAFPVVAALTGAATHVLVLAILLGVAITVWHRDNLVRLARGREPEWKLGSSRRDSGGER